MPGWWSEVMVRYLSVLLICLWAGRLTAQESADLDMPVLPAVFARAGDALVAQDYDQAVIDLSLFILFNPTHAEAHYQRAFAYLQLGNTQEAAVNYADWIRLMEVAIQPVALSSAGIPELLPVETGVVYSGAVSLEAGQQLSVIATNTSGAVDPLMLLLDPAGNPLLASDNAAANDPSAVIDNFTAAETGVYLLLIAQPPPLSAGELLVVVEAR
jgi:tetratricopeptide (TPR) repeat protein